MNQKKKWNILEIINWTSDFLEKKGITESRYKIELLLSEILNMKRFELYMNFEYQLLESENKLFKSYISRLLKNEPVQYILGKWDFYGYELKVDKNVLIPRRETEELTERVINFIENSNFKDNLNILDLCTGSGAIIISLFKELEKILPYDRFKNIRFMASDISKEALNIAKINSDNHNCNIDFIESDLFEKFEDIEINILMSNPPYISLKEYNNLEKQVYFEPKIALTDMDDGLIFYRKIIDFISKRGIKNTFLEIAYNQKNQLKEICCDNNINNYEFFKDLSSNDRILMIKN